MTKELTAGQVDLVTWLSAGYAQGVCDAALAIKLMTNYKIGPNQRAELLEGMVADKLKREALEGGNDA